MESFSPDPFTFDTWLDDEHEMDLSCMDNVESFAEKKQKLLERIKEHQLSRDTVKPKRHKKGSKPPTAKQNSIAAENQIVRLFPTTIFQPRQDDDALFEALFQKRLLPRISPSIRCDCVAEFPTAFTNCLNSGNIDGLQHLVRSCVDHRADIRLLTGAGSLSCTSFCKFFELMNEIHPDRIMCVNTTNVVDNQVTAAVFMKYTDCKLLYQAVARTITDTSLLQIIPATRGQYIAARIQLQNQSQEEQQKLINLVDSDFDLVVYGCVYVTLTFDSITRKATALQMAGNLTSAHVAEIK